MSARSRPPTDELKTVIFDSQSGKARTKAQTTKGHQSGVITVPERGPAQRPVEIPTPTVIDRQHERSEPLQIISMKAPPAALAQPQQGRPHEARQHKAQIRSLSDVMRRHDTPAGGMGYLAPPRDAREVRGRRLRDLLLWGSIVVIVGCVVTLAVWFIAGRG